VEEISHVNEVIKVEQVFILQDLKMDPEEVDLINVNSIEDYMNEETNE